MVPVRVGDRHQLGPGDSGRGSRLLSVDDAARYTLRVRQRRPFRAVIAGSWLTIGAWIRPLRKSRGVSPRSRLSPTGRTAWTCCSAVGGEHAPLLMDLAARVVTPPTTPAAIGPDMQELWRRFPRRQAVSSWPATEQTRQELMERLLGSPLGAARSIRSQPPPEDQPRERIVPKTGSTVLNIGHHTAFRTRV